MRLFTILQAAALASTALATYPLCGFEYPMNYNMTAHIIDGTSPDPEIVQLGVATAFGNPGGPIPWPRDSHNLITIPYCYARQWDRHHVQEIFERGINEWYAALGGKASKQSGHGIVFKERVDDKGQPLTCRKAGGVVDWNPDVPYDTLAVVWTAGKWGATLGLMRQDPPGPWKSQFMVSNKWDVASTMHEMAHVFGLAHEHQRPDRDTYIAYNCEKLADFKKVFALAKSDDPTITPWELCNDFTTSLKYQFRGFEYIKGATIRKEWTIRVGGFYDYDSITHYGTTTDGTPECNTRFEREECALMKWTDARKVDVEPLAEYTTKPSRWDLEWIKKQYERKDPPK